MIHQALELTDSQAPGGISDILVYICGRKMENYLHGVN